MKFRTKTIAVILSLLCIALIGCSKLKARDELNKGVRSFKDAKYETAVEHFKNAVNLDPDLVGASFVPCHRLRSSVSAWR